MSLKSFIEKYFSVFVYVSIAFLLIFLYKYDLFTLDLQQVDFISLLLSFLFLFAGFLINAYGWYSMCKLSNPIISITDGIISHGLAIFGKYIPGKVWVILGRATYVTRTGMSFKKATQLSFYTQGLSIWVGFTIGLTAVAGIYSETLNKWFVILSWAAFSLLILVLSYTTPSVKGLFFSSPRDKSSSSTMHAINRILKVLVVFFVFWLFWTVAFFFFLESVLPDGHYPWYTAFTFPLAATISILLIVFPGGLGVREGLLVFLLMKSGLSIEQATLISLTSRIWFTAGEVFIFGMALGTRYVANCLSNRNMGP